MLGFKHINAFITVIEEKSFTKAAEKLYLTQPALSIQIKNLENDLGIKLVERKDKDIILTEAGEMFYPEAKKILDCYRKSKEAMIDLKELGRGSLYIGASTLPGEYIIPNIIAEFRERYPIIKIEMIIGDSQQIVKALKSREVQIGFLGAQIRDPLLELKEFRKDELYIITPPDWPENYDWSIFPLEELILREKGSGTRQVVEEYLNANWKINKEIKPKLEIGSTRAIINMVSAGLGISYVSSWAFEEPYKLGKIKVFFNPAACITRNVYSAVLKDSYLSYAARTFWQMALSESLS